MMRAELLTVAGCPNAAVAYERLRTALDEVGVSAAIETIEIDTPERARQLRFIGSPTIRIEGLDVEPAARRRHDYGLSCRVYQSDGARIAGLPDMEMVRAAIRSAAPVASRDILLDWRSTAALYGVPVLAIFAVGFPAVTPGWRTAIWTAALGTMGAGCVANTLRCGRVHCYLTGPFLLIMAIIALLYGLGIVPLGRFGWNTLAALALAGTLLLYFVPEFFAGRYRRERG